MEQDRTEDHTLTGLVTKVMEAVLDLANAVISGRGITTAANMDMADHTVMDRIVIAQVTTHVTIAVLPDARTAIGGTRLPMKFHPGSAMKMLNADADKIE
jgi:hypothetical protein